MYLFYFSNLGTRFTLLNILSHESRTEKQILTNQINQIVVWVEFGLEIKGTKCMVSSFRQK